MSFDNSKDKVSIDLLLLYYRETYHVREPATCFLGLDAGDLSSQRWPHDLEIFRVMSKLWQLRERQNLLKPLRISAP